MAWKARCNYRALSVSQYSSLEPGYLESYLHPWALILQSSFSPFSPHPLQSHVGSLACGVKPGPRSSGHPFRHAYCRGVKPKIRQEKRNIRAQETGIGPFGQGILESCETRERSRKEKRVSSNLKQVYFQCSLFHWEAGGRASPHPSQMQVSGLTGMAL